jgi:hypothetical protein
MPGVSSRTPARTRVRPRGGSLWMATEYWLWHSLREAGYGVPCDAMIGISLAPSRRSNRSAIGRQLQCICSIGVWCKRGMGDLLYRPLRHRRASRPALPPALPELDHPRRKTWPARTTRSSARPQLHREWGRWPRRRPRPATPPPAPPAIAARSENGAPPTGTNADWRHWQRRGRLIYRAILPPSHVLFAGHVIRGGCDDG